MKDLAVKNWLRRARLSNQRKTRLPAVNIEESDLIDATAIMVTVDDVDAAVAGVEASELGGFAEDAGGSGEISGTPVSFVSIDD